MARFNTLLGCLVCLRLTAQVAPTEVRISNETVPAGSLAQIKVSLTSPKPITTGNMSVDLSGVAFDSIDGIALFSATGDVVGAAVVNGGQINARFTSPKGTFGTNDYPLLTVALTLSQTVLPGQKFPVIMSPTASLWHDLLGSTLPISVLQGSITVGGSVSITNVVPGGGFLPPGGSFSVFGVGFSPKTRINVRGMSSSSITYVSPTEFRVTVRDGGWLDGTLIQAQNPDNIIDSYYSYMRGVPMGTSARPLLARTVPVFSLLTATEAALPSTISPQVNPAYFTAIALQNPSANDASVTVEARSGAGAVLGSTAVTLPSRARFTREVSELFGFTLPTNGYLHIASSQPVQVEGLLGCDSTGVVLPLAATVLAGPPAPIAPPPTPSGGSGGSGKPKP